MVLGCGSRGAGHCRHCCAGDTAVWGACADKCAHATLEEEEEKEGEKQIEEEEAAEWISEIMLAVWQQSVIIELIGVDSTTKKCQQCETACDQLDACRVGNAFPE